MFPLDLAKTGVSGTSFDCEPRCARLSAQDDYLGAAQGAQPPFNRSGSHA
jgi:hypothetical protein